MTGRRPPPVRRLTSHPAAERIGIDQRMHTL
ncbi:hypothetical protein QE381_002336 [Microbacterium sp. SORGH_AS 888]|nr:hypothetical protein [Microbacterium sp. SORGH_AS_0888]